MAPRATLVLGASPKPDRYSNRAVRHLAAYGHPVIAIGVRHGTIDAVPILTAIPTGTQVHTVVLYLSPANQARWRDEVLALRPQRIIFVPGAENPAFEEAAIAQGIEAVQGCTMVMLSVGTY